MARDTLGSAANEPIIKVSGIDTYPTTGQLDMTVVAVTPADARLSLPQALLSYWLPHRDALPRDSVYAAGKSAEQVESEDADMMVAGTPLAQLLGEYARQCATSDEIIAGHSLEEAGRHPDFDAAAATLRWMLIHMVEETARHAGHLDAIRELLDGRKGYY